MHPLLIDWLRKIHLNADTALATKRWKLAESFAEKITRKEILLLLRAFLFESVQPELIKSLTEQFLQTDKEFPASDNTQEVRLMAGIIMIVAFSERTADADAFALGIKAAIFPGRTKPIQTQIVTEASKYLEAEAEIMRPANYGTHKTSEEVSKNVAEIHAADDDETREAAQAKLSETLHKAYGVKIQRLAEETAVLWWLLGGYSYILKQRTDEIKAEDYALIAAAEVAERTQLLPPPPSIYPIIGRALTACKEVKSKITLKQFVNVADSAWRKEIVAKHVVTDCAEFVPFLTALTKTEEAGDVDGLVKVLSKICPGVSAEYKLTPWEAAGQFYSEIIFLKALANLK